MKKGYVIVQLVFKDFFDKRRTFGHIDKLPLKAKSPKDTIEYNWDMSKVLSYKILKISN